jgi:hypothetical protein
MWKGAMHGTDDTKVRSVASIFRLLSIKRAFRACDNEKAERACATASFAM